MRKKDTDDHDHNVEELRDFMPREAFERIRRDLRDKSRSKAACTTINLVELLLETRELRAFSRNIGIVSPELVGFTPKERDSYREVLTTACCAVTEALEFLESLLVEILAERESPDVREADAIKFDEETTKEIEDLMGKIRRDRLRIKDKIRAISN